MSTTTPPATTGHAVRIRTVGKEVYQIEVDGTLLWRRYFTRTAARTAARVARTYGQGS